MNNPTPNSTRTRPQRFGFDVRLLAVLFCFSMAAWSAFGAKPSPQPAMASGSAQQLAVHDIAKPQPHAPQEVRSIPIGEYDVAFQVVAGNPTGEHDTEFGDTVDPPLWRVLTLIAKKKDGSLADVRLLRRERPPGPVLNLGGALHLGVRLGGRFFWRSGRGVLRGDILGWLRGARRPNGRDAVRRSPLSLRVTRPKQL